MNCKPGQLAIYVGDNQRNLGEVYTVLRPYDGPELPLINPGGPAWWIEHRGIEWHCQDKHLRPIRPGDISDSEVEELYRAPSLPVKEQA